MHQYQLNMVHIGGSMHIGRFANVNIDNILSARLKRRLTGLEKQAIQNSDSTDWLFSENKSQHLLFHRTKVTSKGQNQPRLRVH